MNDKINNPLGQTTAYPDHYDPSLLFSIPRAQARQQLLLGDGLPFRGQDLWSFYELSWLNAKGKPQVAMAELGVDCLSQSIVESKSLKLYLNSLNQQCFDSREHLKDTLMRDLSTAFGGQACINLYSLSEGKGLCMGPLLGNCIDQEDIAVEHYLPQPDLLQIYGSQQSENVILYTHLLKTNCPITGQPDWATVFVEYTGPSIIAESLLAYCISFRNHQDYHEHCVERMFCDISNRCHPERLSVYARYTRRGGLDINPFRTNYPDNESSLEELRLRITRQ